MTLDYGTHAEALRLAPDVQSPAEQQAEIVERDTTEAIRIVEQNRS